MWPLLYPILPRKALNACLKGASCKVCPTSMHRNEEPMLYSALRGISSSIQSLRRSKRPVNETNLL